MYFLLMVDSCRLGGRANLTLPPWIEARPFAWGGESNAAVQDGNIATLLSVKGETELSLSRKDSNSAYRWKEQLCYPKEEWCICYNFPAIRINRGSSALRLETWKLFYVLIYQPHQNAFCVVYDPSALFIFIMAGVNGMSPALNVVAWPLHGLHC